MEFAMDAPPRSYGVFQEDVPYTRNNMRQYPRASSAPVKKLIHEDISSMRPNEGHKRAPSVIARLMGMDSPPLSSATGQLIAVAHSDDRRRQEMIIARPVTRRDPAEMISTKHVSFVEHKNPPARQATKHEIRPFDDDDESKRSNGGGDDDRWSKPVPREHPQEEELQKFKKEFEAWQTSRVWEQSRTLELETRHGAVVLDDNDDDRRCSEIVPYRYHHQQQQKQGYRGRDTGGNDNGDGEVHWRRRRNKDGGASISGSRTFSVASSAGDDYSSRLPLSRFYREEEEEQRSSPTRIVVLRPCPELSADDVSELSLVGSPQLMKKENDMEAFLEEVRRGSSSSSKAATTGPPTRGPATWPTRSGSRGASPARSGTPWSPWTRTTSTRRWSGRSRRDPTGAAATCRARWTTSAEMPGGSSRTA